MNFHASLAALRTAVARAERHLDASNERAERDAATSVEGLEKALRAAEKALRAASEKAEGALREASERAERAEQHAVTAEAPPPPFSHISHTHTMLPHVAVGCLSRGPLTSFPVTRPWPL